MYIDCIIHKVLDTYCIVFSDSRNKWKQEGKKNDIIKINVQKGKKNVIGKEIRVEDTQYFVMYLEASLHLLAVLLLLWHC